MMNIKGIFAVSLIAMVAMVAGAHTSNAVAAIASKGYVDQQVGSKLSSISGSTTGSGNVVTSVSASGSNVSANKGITAEETKNKVTSVRAAASATDTAYPSEKAVATALAGKADATDLDGKVDIYQGDAKANQAVITNGTGNITTGFITKSMLGADVEIPAKITVDSALSSTSTNPVQNKVINTALAGKQATLSAAQLNAVNSGITSTKVSTYDGYNEKITAAQNAANAKVATAQGPGNANKAVITNSSGNVTTGQIASGMIADGTIVDADIAANAKIATSKISGLAKVATSGLYGDLTGTPTIPTVNNATLTIQKNGSMVDTFTANASANKTINITVPTATSQLTNDSNFITADTLPVATADTLGGVKSGGDITVATSGTVTVNSAKTATNAKNATNDAEGNDIISTYATKDELPAASDILTTTTVTSLGTGAVLTGVSVTAGKVTLQKGNVQIPSGGQDATSYVSIWVE